MKARVDSDIHASLSHRAATTSPPEAQRLDRVANEIRGSAIKDVVEKDRELARTRGLARVAQVINYLFGILYTLLAVRLILSLAAARSGAGFVQFIDRVTNPFYLPFRGIVASPELKSGGYTLVLPLLICIGAYALLHAGILGAMRLIAHRETRI